MEKKESNTRREYDEQFKLKTLKDYYESGMSFFSFSKQCGVSPVNIRRWDQNFEKRLLSLPSDITELERKVSMARKKHIDNQPLPQTEEERLREENERLRKALAYSELRNEALSEIVKLSKDKYGIDLLKKAGAKQ